MAKRKLEIGQEAKVSVLWKTMPMNCTKENERNIISRFAQKYGIPEKNVSVEAVFCTEDGKTGTEAINGETINSVKDPEFQKSLFKAYADVNKIEDFPEEEINAIDNQVNGKIDYSAYEVGGKYSINWVKWSNFLSYGVDNFFDFRTLKGLVLLNGEPANQSGKSTFAYDLIHFLLFGKTRSGKADTLDQYFNKYMPECNEVSVAGSITVNGEEYQIFRTLTKPAKTKKAKFTVTSKVQYFHVLAGDNMEELQDSENASLENNVKTNQVIKEAIGDEKDFDLTVFANSDNLKSLIALKDADRSRTFDKWTGLDIISEKESAAKDMWKQLNKGRYCDIYNREALKQEIDKGVDDRNAWAGQIAADNVKIEENNKLLSGYNTEKETLLSSKKPIDPELMRVDLATIVNNMNRVADEGKRIVAIKETAVEKLKSYEDVIYDENEYNGIVEHCISLRGQISAIENDIRNRKKNIEILKTSEYCPTCGRKYDNIDNSAAVAQEERIVADLEANLGSLKASEYQYISKKQQMEVMRTRRNEKSQIELQISRMDVDIVAKREEYKDLRSIKDKSEANKAAIEENNRIDTSLNIVNTNIKTVESIIQSINSDIASLNQEIANSLNEETNKKAIIKKIEEEERTEKVWTLYLKMVGKDGISKMVLRKIIPIINGELNRLIDGVCDFNITVEVTDKNDVMFYLERAGVKSPLSSGSGYEQTIAALALRSVLSKMSSLPKPNFIILDEVWGGVAKENYDNVKKMLDKIVADYDYAMEITHLNDIVDWHNTIITVKKENLISHIFRNDD